MIALVCAIIALLVYLLAFFGAGVGVDLVVLGHVFVAATLLAMNLPPRVRR